MNNSTKKALAQFEKLTNGWFFHMSKWERKRLQEEDNYKSSHNRGYVITKDKKLISFCIWDEPFVSNGQTVHAGNENKRSYVKVLKTLTDEEYLDFNTYAVKGFIAAAAKQDNSHIASELYLRHDYEAVTIEVDCDRYILDDEWHYQNFSAYENKIKGYLAKHKPRTEQQTEFKERVVRFIKDAVTLITGTDDTIKYRIDESDGGVTVVMLSNTHGGDDWQINADMCKFMRVNGIKHNIVAAIRQIVEACELHDGTKYCVQIGDYGAQRDSIRNALKLAEKAHAGQLDKVGVPYIEHAKAVSGYCKSYLGKIAGLLHDVMEDGGITDDDIRNSNIGGVFNWHILVAVNSVTKRSGESVKEYLKRVALHELAIEVKLADMRHNSDPSRWPAGKKAAAEKNRAKYFERANLLCRYAGINETNRLEFMTQQTADWFWPQA